MPFRQNNNLLYLCGIDQEETILILCPGHTEKDFQEILLIKKTSEQIKIWEGEKVTIKQAQEISGVQTVLWTEEFDAVLEKITSNAEYIYLSHNDHPRANVVVETRNMRMGKK